MAETSSNPHPEAAGGDTPSFEGRLRRLASALADRGLSSLALNPGPSLTYLTGLHFHLMERPVVALIGTNAPVVLVVPELEKAKVESLPFPAQVFLFGEDPGGWPATFRQAAQAAGIDNQAIGVEPTRLRFLELKLLEGAAPRARFVSAEESLATSRMCKEAGEIAAMRKAVEIAQQALLATLPHVQAGVTERQVAAELTVQLLRAGSDTEFPFAPIVSGGPNSANPHATPSDRALQYGDLLVIDWGATYHDYLSDLTRTFYIGAVEEEFVHIAQVVLQANTSGRAAAGPGVQAGRVDAAARAVIEQAGYGAYFTHRTGHGIGLEAHEGPYIRAGNELILEPGMTFTVEPGIYLPGRGGVRIEDNVLITAQGAESLSDLPRELQGIGK
jgi:Xaa-Pro dipeptidase